MGVLEAMAGRVAGGVAVEFRPAGSSMVPLIRSRNGKHCRVPALAPVLRRESDQAMGLCSTNQSQKQIVPVEWNRQSTTRIPLLWRRRRKSTAVRGNLIYDNQCRYGEPLAADVIRVERRLMFWN